MSGVERVVVGVREDEEGPSDRRWKDVLQELVSKRAAMCGATNTAAGRGQGLSACLSLTSCQHIQSTAPLGKHRVICMPHGT